MQLAAVCRSVVVWQEQAATVLSQFPGSLRSIVIMKCSVRALQLLALSGAVLAASGTLQ